MSFVKLMQPNGTTLNDEIHDLLIYRIDNKKFIDNDASYLGLPSTRADLAQVCRPSVLISVYVISSLDESRSKVFILIFPPRLISE